MSKPLIKWVGGKTQLLHIFQNEFPQVVYGDYHEIFVGGGSVLLWMLNRDVRGQIWAYDANPTLISMYNFVKTKPHQLHDQITKFINGMCEKQYYHLRDIYNTMDPVCLERAALFIVLNKTCFRGLYRIGPNGFNVPWGHYKDPNMPTLDHILEVSQKIQRVQFVCADFSQSLKTEFKSDDFVYLDPPYIPTEKTSFVNYTATGNEFDHVKLLHIVKSLPCCWRLSNSNHSLIDQVFAENEIVEIVAKRSINSKNPGARAIELLVWSPNHS